MLVFMTGFLSRDFLLEAHLCRLFTYTGMQSPGLSSGAAAQLVGYDDSDCGIPGLWDGLETRARWRS